MLLLDFLSAPPIINVPGIYGGLKVCFLFKCSDGVALHGGARIGIHGILCQPPLAGIFTSACGKLRMTIRVNERPLDTRVNGWVEPDHKSEYDMGKESLLFRLGSFLSP